MSYSSRSALSLARFRGFEATAVGSVTALRVSLWIVLAFLVLLPLGAVISLALTGNSWHEIINSSVLEATFNSVVSATVSAALAVLFGTLLAVLLHRTDIRGARFLRLLALSPMLVPPFVGAIAWLSLLGPTSALNNWWAGHFGSPLWNLYGADGVIFLLTLHSIPIAMIIVNQTLNRIPADLEQAARIAGANGIQTALHITIPLLWRAITAAFTLIAVSNLADFGIPAIIGLPERYQTLATTVYRYLQSATVVDPLATVATIGFVLLLLAVFGLVISFNRDSGNELDTSNARPAILSLGRWRNLTSLLTAILILAVTILPLCTLTVAALLPAPGVALTLDNISLDGFVKALTAPATMTGITNSLMLASFAAVICWILGLAVGTLVTRTRARSNRLLSTIALLPQAVPGLIIAVAWLLLAPMLGLINTPWIILLAYVTAFLSLVVQAVIAPLATTPNTAEDAARISGASPLRALWDISCRMAIPAATSGAILVALTAVRELTLSVLLLSPGSQTLGVVIFNLHQSGNYSASAALSVIVTIVGLLLLTVTVRGSKSLVK